ncbi:MAG TPA: DNA translocase FtsK 4TM domain-containing protein, partial [Holophaga sp.]|nr:DNA translocase FtsK 4TM domain-containing protein [Holophaga sp.]
MGRILLRVLAGALALVILLSLASYDPLDPHAFASGGFEAPLHNLCGTFGALLAGSLQMVLGVGAWLVPVYIIWECFPTGSTRWPRRVAWFALALAVWTLLGALGPRIWQMANGQTIELRWGGWIGRTLYPPCRRALGPVGLPLLASLLMAVSLALLAPGLTRRLGDALARWLGTSALPWFKPLPGKGARAFLSMIRRPFLRQSPQKDVPDLDASDALEMGRESERALADRESIEALERAERESALYRRRNPPPEPDLPVIHSLHLDVGPEDLPGDLSVIVVERPVTPAEPLPPPALLRDLPPPPPPKPQLVAPKVAKDAFGRVALQQPLGMTEPTP